MKDNRGTIQICLNLVIHTLIDSFITFVPSECLCMAASMPFTVFGSFFPSSVDVAVLTDILSTESAAVAMSLFDTSDVIVAGLVRQNEMVLLLKRKRDSQDMEFGIPTFNRD